MNACLLTGKRALGIETITTANLKLKTKRKRLTAANPWLDAVN